MKNEKEMNAVKKNNIGAAHDAYFRRGGRREPARPPAASQRRTRPRTGTQARFRASPAPDAAASDAAGTPSGIQAGTGTRMETDSAATAAKIRQISQISQIRQLSLGYRMVQRGIGDRSAPRHDAE